MVKIYKFFIYVTFFVVMLYAFFPKKNIYYFAEQKLSAFGIIINNETIQENLFSIKLQHADLYVQNIKSATVGNAKCTFLGFYDVLKIKNILLATIANNFLPKKIEEIKIEYTIIHPLSVALTAKGAFGTAKGHFNILNKKVFILFKPSHLMLQQYQNSLQLLKKLPNGEYSYEKTL